MNRRLFNQLLLSLPTTWLMKRKRGVTITLDHLDPRLVEQLKVAAASRQLSLVRYIVLTAIMESGYHENDGFVEDKL